MHKLSEMKRKKLNPVHQRKSLLQYDVYLRQIKDINLLSSNVLYKTSISLQSQTFLRIEGESRRILWTGREKKNGESFPTWKSLDQAAVKTRNQVVTYVDGRKGRGEKKGNLLKTFKTFQIFFWGLKLKIVVTAWLRCLQDEHKSWFCSRLVE